MTRPSPNRFRVRAFVGTGKVHEPKIEGWALAGDIYASCPFECRYAVLETSAGKFIVWDTYAEDFFAAFRKNACIPSLWTGDNLDALIMKAMALYDRA